MRASARTCVLLCLGLGACDSPREDSPTTTTGGGSTTNDNPNTTIPVTSVSATLTTADNTSTTDATDSDASTSSGGDTDSTSSSSGSGSGSSSTSGSTSTGDATSSTSSSSSSETTDGPQVFEIGWCNLQYPPTIPEPDDMQPATTATVTTAYSRIYIEDLTDQNPTNDPHAQVLVEFGYGADGSLPAAGGWTWTAGSPNAGWNGTTAGQADNDEYQGDLQFDAPGTYDFAARVSGDGGTLWVYCDLNGLVDGGYTVDQAGAAVIE